MATNWEDFTPIGEQDSDAVDWSQFTPQSRSTGEIAGDIGSQLGKGVNTTLGAIPNLISPDSKVAKFFNENAEYWEGNQSEITRSLSAAADAKVQEAAKNGEWEAFKAAVAEYGTEPALVQKLITENVPSLIPGLGAAKGAQAASLAAGVAGKTAITAGVAAGSATNAAMNAGGARQDSFQDWKNTLMTWGMGEEEATEVALKKSRLAAGVGAVTGAVSGGTGLERGILGAVGKGGALGFAKKAGAELLGEQAEELAPQLATNLQIQSVDPTRKATDQLGQVAAQTLVASGPGSILSGAIGARKPTVEDIGTASTVDEAIAAATAVVDSPVDVTPDSASAVTVPEISQPAEATAQPESNAEFDDFLRQEQIDATYLRQEAIDAARKQRDFELAEQQRREADVPAMQEQVADQQVEQADALTSAQGFDAAEPTAMQLAMQKALERRQLAMTPVSQRKTDQVESQQPIPTVRAELSQNPTALPLESTGSLAAQPVQSSASLASPENPNSTPAKAFSTPHESRVQRHFEKAEKEGIPREYAEKLQPEETLDSVTGFNRAEEKVPTVQRAQQYAEETGKTAHFVDADIANLGGINASFNNNAAEANKVYRGIADIFAEEMNKAGEKAVLIRHGGDEISAVIIGGDESKINAAMQRAQERVSEYAAQKGLSDIENPKYKDDPSRRGIGLYLGQAEIKAGKSLDTLFSEASAGLDAGKKGKVNVTRKKSVEAGADASIERSGGVPESGAGIAREDEGSRGERAPRVSGEKTSGESKPTGRVVTEEDGSVFIGYAGKNIGSKAKITLKPLPDGRYAVMDDGYPLSDFDSGEDVVLSGSQEEVAAHVRDNIESLFGKGRKFFKPEQKKEKVTVEAPAIGTKLSDYTDAQLEEAHKNTKSSDARTQIEKERERRKRAERLREVTTPVSKRGKVSALGKQKGSFTPFATSEKTSLPDTITVDGVPRPTTNTEGKPIAGTVEGIENFWRWFGDSKVVDGDGKPLVVYHGTNAEFKEFDLSKVQAEGGHWFATNKRFAGVFGERVIAASLSVRDPLELSEATEAYPLYVWLEILAEQGVHDVQFDSALSEQIPYAFSELLPNRGNVLEGDGTLLQQIKAAGFDGIHAPDERAASSFGKQSTGDVWIAFDPTQIKSATGNNGNFDPSDPILLHAGLSPIEAIENIRKKIEEYKKSSRQSVSKYRDQNKRIREEHITSWDKSKKWLKRQLTPGGLLPKSVFDEKIKRDSEFEVIEFDVKHLVGQFEHALKEEYGSADDINEKSQRLLSDALAGRISNTLKEKTKTALLGMRQYIDNLSIQYVKALGQQQQDLLEQAVRTGDSRLIAEANEKAALIETIMGNVGAYVHRSYRAFDDPKWANKVPDDVLDAAREYLVSRGTEKPEVILNEILKHGTAYDSMESFIKESKLGAKDLSVLKTRKEIAPEIRALLGEYTDPRINFAKSATKMGRLIWNQAFLDRVREIGVGQFLFDKDSKPPEATAPIAAEGSEVYAPLNGLWTTPEVNQAFKDALGKEHMDDWYKKIVQINGAIKYGKTVLSPTTALRNWYSAAFFAIANGHFDMRHMKKSVDGFKEYFKHDGDDKQMAYLRELKHLGVVYDTPYAGEMMRLLADSNLSDMLVMGKAQLKVKHALDMATKFYQYGDDFWKIIGFENEKRMWMDTGMSEQDAKVKAAERIRNTYPTYSMVGRGIQSLRRFPLVGTFVSFPAEIIRTSYNMVRYIGEDYKDPKTRKMAIRRAAGLAIASSFAYAAQALSMAMLGYDDEDEEAVRQMAAPWQKNSSFVFTGRDEKGNLRYMDMSFLDPYNYWKRPIIALTRGQPADTAIKESLSEVLKPFFGADIAADTVFQVLANKKNTGAPVYKEYDDAANQFKDIAQHLRKALQPGIMSNMERTYKALSGEVKPSGQKYDPADEAAAWVGFRMSTLDPKVALYYRSFEFKDAKSDSEKKLRDTIRDPNEVDSEDLRDAYDHMQKLRKQAYSDMNTIVKAARRSGMNNQQISEVLKNSGVSQNDSLHLKMGKVPKWRPADETIDREVKKARATFGQDGAKRVKDRYREVKSYGDGGSS